MGRESSEAKREEGCLLVSSGLSSEFDGVSTEQTEDGLYEVTEKERISFLLL